MSNVYRRSGGDTYFTSIFVEEFKRNPRCNSYSVIDATMLHLLARFCNYYSLAIYTMYEDTHTLFYHDSQSKQTTTNRGCFTIFTQGDVPTTGLSSLSEKVGTISVDFSINDPNLLIEALKPSKSRNVNFPCI